MCLILFIVILLLVSGFLIWASSDVGSGVYLKTLCRSRADRKVVALTFDDGPDALTSEVLDILGRYGVKGSFFLIGSKVRENASVVRRMVTEGHIVAGHSWSHRGFFPLSSYDDVMAEIRRTDDVIAEVCGKRPALFRPPFGVTNPRIGRAVRNCGLTAIGWSIRSLDTDRSRTREQILERITSRISPGDVILLHDRCEGAGELVEMLLKYLKVNGYEVVSIEELFDIDAYVE